MGSSSEGVVVGSNSGGGAGAGAGAGGGVDGVGVGIGVGFGVGAGVGMDGCVGAGAGVGGVKTQPAKINKEPATSIVKIISLSMCVIIVNPSRKIVNITE